MSVTGVSSNLYMDDTMREPKKTLDKDAFLELLVAQLKYQNPMEPQSSEQFMAQMTQLSMVEQLTNIAEKMNDLILAGQLNQSSSLIGHQVAINGEDDQIITGVVDKVIIRDNKTLLQVNGTEYPYESLLEISNAPTTANEPEAEQEAPAQAETNTVIAEGGSVSEQNTAESSTVADSGTDSAEPGTVQ